MRNVEMSENRPEKSAGNQKNKLLIVLIAALTVIGIGLFVVIRYQFSFSTNDDVMIKAILRGDITGSPDAHLVYVMYPMGWLLKCLYCINNNIPWYDGCIVLLHFAVYFFVIFRTGKILSEKKTGIVIMGEIIAGLLLLSLDLPYLIMHQYTSLAALLFAVGLFYYITSDDGEKGTRIKDYVVTGVFLLLSFWMRKQVFLMGIPLLGLAVVYRFQIKKKIPKDKLVFALVLLAGLLLSFLWDKAAYSSKEWKDFQTYNEARTDIYDFYGFPPYDETMEEYNKRDLIRTDLYPFGTWDLALFENCYEDKMTSFAEFSKGYWNNLHYQKWAISFTAKQMKGYFTGKGETVLAPVLLILLPVCILAMLLLKRWKAAVLLVLGMLYEFAFVFYFMFRGRFPERVAYGFFFLIIVFTLGIVAGEIIIKGIHPKKEKFEKFIKLAGVILASAGVIAMAATSVLQVRSTDRLAKEQNDRIEEWEKLNAYFVMHPENTYYLKTNVFAQYGEKMFRKETFEKNNFIRLGTWIVGSPLYKTQLEQKSSEPWNRIVEDDKVYFTELEVTDRLWIPNFYEGHGIPVDVETVDEILLLGEERNLLILSVKKSGRNDKNVIQ